MLGAGWARPPALGLGRVRAAGAAVVAVDRAQAEQDVGDRLAACETACTERRLVLGPLFGRRVDVPVASSGSCVGHALRSLRAAA